MTTHPDPPASAEDQYAVAARREAAASVGSAREILPPLAAASALSGALCLFFDTGEEPWPGMLGLLFAALLGGLWRISSFEAVRDWTPLLTVLTCWTHGVAALILNPALSASPVAVAAVVSWWLAEGVHRFVAVAAAMLLVGVYALSGAPQVHWVSATAATAVLIPLIWKLRYEWSIAVADVCARDAEDFAAAAEPEPSVSESNLDRRPPEAVLEAYGETDLLWEWNLADERVRCSARWRELFQYVDRSVEWPAKEWFNLVHPHDIGDLTRRLNELLEHPEQSLEYEHRMREADGSYRWVTSRARVVAEQDGTPLLVAGSQTDIARVKSYEEQLLHQATHDVATGLANREMLAEWLVEEADKARRSETYQYALALFDVDGLSNINDTLGHGAGDRVLALLADRLQEFFGDEHRLARTGGDEFAVVVSGARSDPETARLIRDAVTAARQPIPLAEGELTVEIDVGIAVCDADDDPDAALRSADIALSAGKAMDGERITFFRPDMGRAAARQFRLQQDLREAFEQGRFELFYQPILAAQEGRIVCAEALMRLRAEDGGIVPPSEFIPVAEKMDLIHDLGRWAVEEGCRQAMAWSEAGLPLIEMSVNVSVRQFERPGFVQAIRSALRRSGLPPKKLQLEITESDLIELRDLVPEALDRLALLGVKTAIDDFGVGYSALSYLRDLRCDTLKIDRSFVNDVAADPRCGAVARSIIGLAHNLDLGVVAEGVETPAQIDFLRGAGCDRLQGYFASRPVPAKEFRELLKDGGRLGIGPKPAARSSHAAVDGSFFASA